MLILKLYMCTSSLFQALPEEGFFGTHIQLFRKLLAGVSISLFALSPLHSQENLLDHYYGGEYRTVIELADQALTEGDTAFETFYLKALSESQSGRSDEAVKTLDHALETHPGSPRLIRARAGQLYEAGYYNRAKEDYTFLVSLDSSDISSWMKLADIASFSLKYDEAIRTLNRILVLDSMNLGSLMKMGEILDRLNSASAIVFYKRASEGYPENQKAAYALANEYIEIKQANKAIPVCARILAIDSSIVRFQKLKGYAHYKSGESDRAVYHLTKAATLGDSSSFTLKYLGISQYLLANFQGAIGSLEGSLRRDSLDAEVHFFLGTCLGTTRDKEAAMYHLDRSLELMQPDPVVVSRIHSEQGNIKRLEMEYQEAYSYYSMAWEADSTRPISLYYMASILDNSMRKKKEALADYERFIEELDKLPEEEAGKKDFMSVRRIVETRIESIKEELFFRDEDR